MTLDNSQQLAVEHTGGPLLVLAGPGSGKTRVLCHRIATLANAGTPPGRILAVTFTRKASIEMAERLQAMMDYPPQWVMTFHRLCARILRQSGPSIGLEPAWSIADTTKSRGVTRRAIEDLRLKLDEWPPAEEQGKISLRKNREIEPTEAAASADGYVPDRLKASLRIHRRYLRIMADEHLLDFDDLLINTVRVMNIRDERTRWTGRWDHVLVDEFQDTNIPQYRIMKALAAHHQVTAVGDPDQSIYGWRGAERRNLEQFSKDFKPTIIELGLNYRSTPNIVAAARHLLESPTAKAEDTTDRSDRYLRSTRERGMPVTVIVHPSDNAEAVWIHNLGIEEINKGGDAAAHRVGVLYRVNSLSRPIEERLIRSSIPYTISGGARFYDRKEIQDALAYLHVINNGEDDEAFERILNRPPRGLGRESLKKIREADIAREAKAADNTPLFATDDEVADMPARNTLMDRTRLAATSRLLTARQSERALHLVEVIESCRRRTVAHRATAEDILETVLFASGYIPHLVESKKAEDHDRLDNLDQLIAAAKEYGKRSASAADNEPTDDPQGEPAGSLQGFLDEAALMTDRQAVDDSTARIHLMTMHAAKGLEFPTVVIAGVEAHLCPLKPRHDEYRLSKEQAHEERRLFYVGMTRAKEELYLSQAIKRTRFGRPEDTTESPYISDLPLTEIEYAEVDAKLMPVPAEVIAKAHTELQEPRRQRGKADAGTRTTRSAAKRVKTPEPPNQEHVPMDFWADLSEPQTDYDEIGYWEDGELRPVEESKGDSGSPNDRSEPLEALPDEDRKTVRREAGDHVFEEMLDYDRLRTGGAPDAID